MRGFGSVLLGWLRGWGLLVASFGVGGYVGYGRCKQRKEAVVLCT